MRYEEPRPKFRSGARAGDHVRHYRRTAHWASVERLDYCLLITAGLNSHDKMSFTIKLPPKPLATAPGQSKVYSVAFSPLFELNLFCRLRVHRLVVKPSESRWRYTRTTKMKRAELSPLKR